MKRKTASEKLHILNKFCELQKCEDCPLIITRYCQLADVSDGAVNEAYSVYLKKA